MDLQKIEPLLMDYALGATTPEVSALIEAYQEKDAEIHARLKQWQGVANLARQAIEDHAPAALPTFPRRRIQKTRRARLWRRAASWSAALAACLMLGYLAGNQEHGPAAPAAMTGKVPVAAVEDFWSTARLRAVAKEDAAQSKSPSDRSLRDVSTLLQQFGG